MDIMQDSVVTHIYIIYIILGVMLFNIISVYTTTNFIRLAKRLRFMTPFYHMLNAMIVYTGAIVAAYARDLSPTVILMIAASIAIMVLEIKRYKKMRVIKTKEVEKQKEFIIFAKKIYTAEILILVSVYILSKVF